MLQISDLHFAYGVHQIINGINLNLNRGEILAITGANGSGKTTLLKLISGELKPQRGIINFQGDTKFSLINQGEDTCKKTVLEYILMDFPQIESVYMEMKKTDESDVKYADLINKYAMTGGFELEEKIVREISGYGFGEGDLSRNFDTFSHGQKRFWAIMRSLLKEVPLVLMDEPTNHLDIEMCLMLENLVLDMKRRNCGLIIISHDRVFIDRVADRTANIKNGHIITINGGYSDMMEHIQREFESRKKKAEEIDKKIKSLEQEVIRRKNWSNKKEAQKAPHTDKGYIGKKSAKLAKRAIAVMRRTEKLIKEYENEIPIYEKPLKMEFPAYEVRNRSVFRCSEMNFSYGDKIILNDVNFEMTTRDRIGIIGANGCGKTTLLNCIIGELKPQCGEVSLNRNVSWKYIPQDVKLVFGSGTLLKNMQTENYEETSVRKYLGGAKFRKEKVYSDIKTLSYGELMRAVILKAMLEKVEFLFLDEPTNHLDIESLEMLDESIEKFPGGVLFISHDRHFIAQHGKNLYTIENTHFKDFIVKEEIDTEEFRKILRNSSISFENSRKREDTQKNEPDEENKDATDNSFFNE